MVHTLLCVVPCIAYTFRFSLPILSSLLNCGSILVNAFVLGLPIRPFRQRRFYVSTFVDFALYSALVASPAAARFHFISIKSCVYMTIVQMNGKISINLVFPLIFISMRILWTKKQSSKWKTHAMTRLQRLLLLPRSSFYSLKWRQLAIQDYYFPCGQIINIILQALQFSISGPHMCECFAVWIRIRWIGSCVSNTRKTWTISNCG